MLVDQENESTLHLLPVAKMSQYVITVTFLTPASTTIVPDIYFFHVRRSPETDKCLETPKEMNGDELR